MNRNLAAQMSSRVTILSWKLHMPAVYLSLTNRMQKHWENASDHTQSGIEPSFLPRSSAGHQCTTLMLEVMVGAPSAWCSME